MCVCMCECVCVCVCCVCVLFSDFTGWKEKQKMHISFLFNTSLFGGVQEGTVIGMGARLGNNNKLAKGVELEDKAVIGAGNDIGEGAKIGKVDTHTYTHAMHTHVYMQVYADSDMNGGMPDVEPSKDRDRQGRTDRDRQTYR